MLDPGAGWLKMASVVSDEAEDQLERRRKPSNSKELLDPKERPGTYVKGASSLKLCG